MENVCPSHPFGGKVKTSNPAEQAAVCQLLSIDSELNLNQVDDGFILLLVDCAFMRLLYFLLELLQLPRKQPQVISTLFPLSYKYAYVVA